MVWRSVTEAVFFGWPPHQDVVLGQSRGLGYLL